MTAHHHALRILGCAIGIGVGSLAAVACEQMNRPAPVPHSQPRTGCFSDVECPGAKCLKRSSDVQGTCSRSGDAGSDAEASPGYAPNHAPAPGDVQL